MRGAFFFDIDTLIIRKDSEGRYCLNDLHKAAGELEQHATWRFFRNQQTDELIEELIKAPNLVVKAAPLEVKRGRNGGTFVVKELVYAYAMWISPAFHLKVIRVFDEYATKGMVMKPEVAKQAFNDPKVFMAKALMLQKTLYCSNQWLPKIKRECKKIAALSFNCRRQSCYQ